MDYVHSSFHSKVNCELTQYSCSMEQHILQIQLVTQTKSQDAEGLSDNPNKCINCSFLMGPSVSWVSCISLWVMGLMHIPLGHGSHAYLSGSWVSCISLWVMGLMHIPLGHGSHAYPSGSGLMHIPLGHGSHAYPSGSWVSCISLWVMGLMHIPLGHGSHAYPSGSWVSCISLWVMADSLNGILSKSPSCLKI